MLTTSVGCFLGAINPCQPNNRGAQCVAKTHARARAAARAPHRCIKCQGMHFLVGSILLITDALMAQQSRQQFRDHAGLFTTATASPPAPEKVAAPVHIPRTLAEVDNGKILGFGADLSDDHPGYHDAAYKQRRVDICNIARTHEMYVP